MPLLVEPAIVVACAMVASPVAIRFTASLRTAAGALASALAESEML